MTCKDKNLQTGASCREQKHSDRCYTKGLLVCSSAVGLRNTQRGWAGVWMSLLWLGRVHKPDVKHLRHFSLNYSIGCLPLVLL